MNSDNLFWSMALQRVAGVGSVIARRLIDRFSSPKAVFQAGDDELAEVLNSSALRAIRQYDPHSDAWIPQELERIAAKNARAMTILDPDYPRNLAEIPDAPIILYIIGEISKRDELAVGIVGTRRPSTYGVSQARRFSQYLVKQGVTIVSGMAMGIDGNAQDAALDAGGRSIAVLGCGVDIVYPPINKKLYSTLIENGVIVSEYPMGTRADTHTFPARNRIISGLSRAVLVIEGSAKSGALITARYAANNGRDVYALPGHIDRPNSAGPNSLIRDGATPALEPADIMVSLKVEPLEEDSRKSIQDSAVQLEGLSKTIFDALDFDGIGVDAISNHTELEVPIILAILTELEMKDIVKRLPGSKYARNV